jgi:hypothetical protein
MLANAKSGLRQPRNLVLAEEFNGDQVLTTEVWPMTTDGRTKVWMMETGDD